MKSNMIWYYFWHFVMHWCSTLSVEPSMGFFFPVTYLSISVMETNITTMSYEPEHTWKGKVVESPLNMSCLTRLCVAHPNFSSQASGSMEAFTLLHFHFELPSPLEMRHNRSTQSSEWMRAQGLKPIAAVMIAVIFITRIVISDSKMQCFTTRLSQHFQRSRNDWDLKRWLHRRPPTFPANPLGLSLLQSSLISPRSVSCASTSTLKAPAAWNCTAVFALANTREVTQWLAATTANITRRWFSVCVWGWGSFFKPDYTGLCW